MDVSSRDLFTFLTYNLHASLTFRATIGLMERLSVIFIALALSFATASAQQPQSSRSFDVASIRPGASATAEMIAVTMNADRSMIHYINVSLRDLIRVAYGVKEFQISGPDWIRSRFDIEAKYPEGATKDEVPEMLRSLLRDRFKLQLHRETKEQAVYALVVGKNGPKLKATTLQATDLPDSANRRPGTPIHGGMQMLAGPSGMHLTGLAVTISTLSETLSRFTDKAIVDQTGLRGEYDIDLTFFPENMMLRMGGGPGGPRQGAEGAPDASSEPRVTIFEAVQQYGLKLEARKAPLTMLIVDHIEKTPTEN
jgi:uncharacterized protein (TIGR03435 family)